MSESITDLGYMSLEQLREYAVDMSVSTDEVHSRMLATNAFRKPLRGYLLGSAKSEDVALSEEEIKAPATIDHPEMGKLINLRILKVAIESAKLSEQRPNPHEFIGVDRPIPPILGEKALDLLDGYIENREQFLGIPNSDLS